MSGSLTLIGSGIKFLSHLSHEAKIYIREADIVLFLVNEPATKNWIQTHAKTSENLDFLYQKHPERLKCYQEITANIIHTLTKGLHVTVVLYGHPCVFAEPGLHAVQQATKLGYHAKILPAISSLDCLFADLQIDPGRVGCQIFETTDFLLHRRLWDPNSYLILWQADVIGALDHAQTHDNSAAMTYLVDYLLATYSETHLVHIYEAALYPHMQPRMECMELVKLKKAVLSPISTLCISPRDKSQSDCAIADLLHDFTQRKC